MINVSQQVILSWDKIYGKYEVRELVLKIPENRYLVRSALQKCIRRGYTQKAMDYASYLYHYDPSKIWRDLAIIAIEDIGVGDPLAVYLALYFDKHRKEREVHRPTLETLMCVVAGLSLAPIKSRACCELSLGADLLARRHTALVEYDLMPTDSELKFNADPTMEAVHTLIPLYVELLQARGKLPGYQKSKDKMEILLESYREHLPHALYHMGELALDRAHDSMFMAALPVAFAFSSAKVEVLPNEFLPEHTIKGVPAMSWDMHVHQGRIAIQSFSKFLMDKDIRVAALQKHIIAKTLGSVIFTEEGGRCNNQIDFASLKAFQDHYFHLGYGVPPDFEDELVNLVRDNIQVLHQKRERCSAL